MHDIITGRQILSVVFVVLSLTVVPPQAFAAEDLQQLRQSAEVDQSAKAQYQLGLRFLQGKRGVEKDEKSAMMWLKRAAEQNYAPAQYKLSELWRSGPIEGLDAVEATEHLMNAAEQGHSNAQYRLGLMYLKGDTVDRDLVAAREWLELAAEHGHKGAAQALAELEKTESAELAAETATAAEEQKTNGENTALAALLARAEEGDADAQFQLGEAYRTGAGQGVSHDLKQAAAWYTKAAKQGHADAQYQLGELYFKGRGVKRNKRTAQKWFKSAASKGHVKAKYRLRGCGFC